MIKFEFIVGLVISLLILLNSCSEDNSFIPQVENGNFILFVSNQSTYIDPIDLKIKIDGKLALNQEFVTLEGHNHIKFQFQLKEGDHTFAVSSIIGNINKDTMFTLPTTPYSVVSFWYYPQSNGNPEYREIYIRFSESAPVFAKLIKNTPNRRPATAGRLNANL